MQTRRNANRYDRESNERLPRGVERLLSYIGKPGYFIHFSNYNKLGLNPTNKYDTPTGFYAYLSDRGMAKFAVDRPFAVVFKPAENARLLDLESYTKADFIRDNRLLAEWAGKRPGFPSEADVKEAFLWAEEEARKGTPGGRIWNVTRVCASWFNQPNHAWSRIINKVLGYDGVVDKCGSVIHDNEPCQAVFFNTSHYGKGSNSFPKLELVDVIESHHRSGFADVRRKPRLTKKDFVAGSEYKEVKFIGVDFSGVDMSGTRFHDCVLTGSKFVGANMQGVVMTMCIAYHVNVTRADLSEATIVDTNLMGAIMKGANMKRASLSRSYIREAKFDGASMSGVDLTFTIIEDTSFKSADLSGADFSSAEIERVDFAGANLERASFRGVKSDTLKQLGFNLK